MTKECQRVLKTGGFFVSISFGQPSSREKHYRRPHLKMETTIVPMKSKDKGPLNHLYIGKKLEGADDHSASRWSQTLEIVRQEEAE